MKHLALATILALATLCVSAHAESEYSGSAKSHTVLDTSSTVAGQAIAWPTAKPAKATVLEITIPPGGATGWHVHPVQLICYVLSGTLTVDLKGGGEKSFHAGQAFAEATNTVHDGHNFGKEPLKLVVFIAGEKGIKYTEKVATP